jgi:hypothetical protein
MRSTWAISSGIGAVWDGGDGGGTGRGAGSSTLTTSGRVGFERSYDADGEIIEIRYPGPDGKLAENDEGIAVKVFRLGEHGNVIETQFLDRNRRALSRPRVAVIRNSWEGDNIAQENSYDSEGRPMKNRFGYAEIRFRYTAQGQRSETFFDEQGQQVEVLGASQLLIGYKGAPKAPALVSRSREQARALAEKLLAKIRAGAPFDAMVKAHSEDLVTRYSSGYLGSFVPGLLPEEIDRGLRGLRSGEISEVVEGPAGFVIVRRMR